MVDSNKIKLLILWDILCKNTDENHAMNTDEIIAELAKRDIPATRKVIPSDIATLNAYGYEVLMYKKKFHYYYVVNRPFDMAEIVMLADVIKASKLTGTQKKTFVEKLCNTLGGYATANACKNMISFDTDKRGNSSIIYNADAIERAINANRQISFLYFDYDKHHEKVYRKDGERYTVSPIIMVWNRDNYYMLCFSERHDNIITYRLDKMDSVQVEKEERIPRNEYETLKKTIVRGICKAVADKKEVLDLILSNLAYAVTGEDDTLEMYAIEKQLKTLSGIMDETVELAASSTGDGKRFQEEMKSLSSQMVVLREQLEIIKGRIDSSEKLNAEIENIKQYLTADSLDFSEYSDVTIRRLVEYIRVMKDNSIIIVLKGGMQIQENIEK